MTGRDSAHHKLVKTTPNPNATKNRRGDELWFCGCDGLVPVLAGGPLSVVDGGADVDAGTILDVMLPVDSVGDDETGEVDDAKITLADVVTACLTTIRAPSTSASLRKAIVTPCKSVGAEKRSCDGYPALNMCTIIVAWVLTGCTSRPE